MIVLFILVANAVAIQCIGIEYAGVSCKAFSYPFAMDLVKFGILELFFELRGFIKIYKEKK